MAVSLEKGQKISLDKTAGSALTQVKMGVGWDVTVSKGFLGFGGGKSGDIDLDASCLMFSEQGEVLDAIWFQQLTSKDGSIRHSGDNRTGAGDGDDETITVDLSRVPAQVKSLIFTVNSFRGQSFEKVQNAYCRFGERTKQPRGCQIQPVLPRWSHWLGGGEIIPSWWRMEDARNWRQCGRSNISRHDAPAECFGLN